MGHAYKYFRLPLPLDHTLLGHLQHSHTFLLLFLCHRFALLDQCRTRLRQVLVTLFVLLRHWRLLINILQLEVPDFDYNAYVKLFQGLATYVRSSRLQMLQYLTLSFTKAIFLAGTVIGFLALTLSLIDGVELHVMYGLTLKFGLAGVLLNVLVAYISVLNTILFTLFTSSPGRNAKERIPVILYQPEISLVFCMFLVIAANLCACLSALFFFIQYNRHMVYVLVGLVVFSFIGHGSLLSLAVVAYFTLRAST